MIHILLSYGWRIPYVLYNMIVRIQVNFPFLTLILSLLVSITLLVVIENIRKLDLLLCKQETSPTEARAFR